MEGVLDADMISILKLTPGIVQNKSGIVCQLVDPADWVKLLTMHDPMTVVKAGQWIQVCNGAYQYFLMPFTFLQECEDSAGIHRNPLE